jgi:hypothetical protein
MFNKQRQIPHGIESHAECFNITRMVPLAQTFTAGVTTAFRPTVVKGTTDYDYLITALNYPNL